MREEMNNQIMCLKNKKFMDKCKIKEFSIQKLTREIFEKINKDDLSGVFYAESGAMGWGGLTVVILNEMQVFYVDTLCDDCDITQFEILKLFDGIKPSLRLHFIEFECLRVNKKKYIYFNLGMGNYLYLQENLYKKLGNYIFDTNLGNRYRNWTSLIGIDEELEKDNL